MVGRHKKQTGGRGQFAEAVKVYTTLQDDFGYEFTQEDFAKDAAFDKFIASPQFKKWLRR